MWKALHAVRSAEGRQGWPQQQEQRRNQMQWHPPSWTLLSCTRSTSLPGVATSMCGCSTAEYATAVQAERQPQGQTGVFASNMHGVQNGFLTLCFVQQSSVHSPPCAAGLHHYLFKTQTDCHNLCVRTCLPSAATCSCRSAPPVMQTVRKPLYFRRSRQMDATCRHGRGNGYVAKVFRSTNLPDDRLGLAFFSVLEA